jgi:hypothetical protein
MTAPLHAFATAGMGCAMNTMTRETRGARASSRARITPLSSSHAVSRARNANGTFDMNVSVVFERIPCIASRARGRYDPLHAFVGQSSTTRLAREVNAVRNVAMCAARCAQCGATHAPDHDRQSGDALRRRTARAVRIGIIGATTCAGRARALSGNGDGNNGGFSGGGGDGGDGSSGGGKGRLSREALGGDTGVLEEVVMLDVHGMHCGGCAASVRKILEGDDDVRSATVNLANESAVVRINLAMESLGGGEFESL